MTEAFVIPALVKWQVIIKGPLSAAVDALAERDTSSTRPLRNVWVSPVAVHATVWAERDEMAAWWAAHDSNQVPGALCSCREVR